MEENEVRNYNIWNTCITSESLLEEMSPIGFTSVGFYADVAGKVSLEDSDTLCGIFKKK